MAKRAAAAVVVEEPAVENPHGYAINPETGQPDPFYFGDIPDPAGFGASGEPLSLDEAVAGLKRIPSWPGAWYVSPKIKTLRRIFAALEAMQSAALTDPMAGLIGTEEAIRVLVRVSPPAPNNGGALRKPTRDEIEERFTPAELSAFLLALLSGDGLAEDESGNR